jgi:hypothetical protein
MKDFMLAVALAGCGIIPLQSSAVLATPLGISAGAVAPHTDVELVAHRAAGGGANHANVKNVNRNVNRNPNVNRNVNVKKNVNVNRNVNVNVSGARYGGWARPGYRWAPGGAIAAGAAIGFVSAATAVAWAGAAPGPGLCWYYTDPTRTQGFWDACP